MVYVWSSSLPWTLGYFLLLGSAHHTFSGGLGISNYRTGIALAGGIQYQPNNDIAFRFNSSINSEQELIFGGGLAYGW